MRHYRAAPPDPPDLLPPTSYEETDDEGHLNGCWKAILIFFLVLFGGWLLVATILAMCISGTP